MFLLVEFADETYEVVPIEWVEGEEAGNIKIGSEVSVAFPPKGKCVRKLISNSSPPHSTWSSFRASVLYTHGKPYTLKLLDL